MPICYEIDIDFERGDEGHEGEQRRIPLQIPRPVPISPDAMDEAAREMYRDWVAKVVGSDPSRASYFGKFRGYNIISIYPC